jgi:hypothetical protein
MRRTFSPFLLRGVIAGITIGIAAPTLRPQTKNKPIPTASVVRSKAPALTIASPPDNSSEDLKAQEDLVAETRRLATATYTLVAVGVLQGVVFFGTLWVIKRQGDITQTQLRPWIAVEKIWLENPHNIPPSLPLFLQTNLGDSSLLFIKIKTTNTGETVGMRVAIPPAKVVAVPVDVPGARPPQQAPQDFNQHVNRMNEANNLARTAALERAKQEFCRQYGSHPSAPKLARV